MSERNFIFTDSDLDGVGCLLVTKWCKGENTPFITTTVTNFRDNLLKWLHNHKLTDYDNVYILDLDVSEHVDLLDYKNVTIIDHHIASYNTNYQNATVISNITCSSATKLVFQHFISHYPELKSTFTKNQLKLISLIDDYDSYTLKYTETVGLNNVLWSMTGDRVGKFYELYKNGFTEFTLEHQNMIAIAKKKVNDAVSGDLFTVTVPLQGKSRKIVSIFCDHNINEVAYEILQRFSIDICLVINLRTKTVSFRKSGTCDVNLAKLAETLCNGGGHEGAAGGKLTDKFLTFSKLFKKYET